LTQSAENLVQERTAETLSSVSRFNTTLQVKNAFQPRDGRHISVTNQSLSILDRPDLAPIIYDIVEMTG
jgi:hypothetical protein